MNNVVLKGKLGAGFNDDRYTLPKDGNPGDILVKTETGSAWQKQEPATSTPDWNQNDPTASDYIKNRPFYTGEIVQTEVIPEQTYTLSSAGSFNMYADESGTYPYSLEEGKNYIVVYNGTTYELTSSISDGFAYVGDIGPLRGEEATVPFAIVAGNGLLQIVDYNGNTEVTFKIIGDRADVIKIDLKYIPELPGYMSKQNPVGYGSFSLNRKADTTVGLNSHAEGNNTTASEKSSHSEGDGTIASGPVSHAEGWYTKANAKFSHAEGANTTASGIGSHAEGNDTTASGDYSHSEGNHTIVSTTEMSVRSWTVEDGMGKYGHAEGFATVVTGQHGAHAEGCKTLSSGNSSHAEGESTTASGNFSHSEGYKTTASGICSHSEGRVTKASGNFSHAEGDSTKATGEYSHAEGSNTTASGGRSHTEGGGTVASGNYSHTEGLNTKASGESSHSEGDSTIAYGVNSHAEGFYTIARGNYSHVQGKCNIDDSDGKYASIVGNGTSDTARSNAHTLDWEGNAWFAGTIEGTAMIVKSSTTNSTKKFKITVDDTGTISATEVT